MLSYSFYHNCYNNYKKKSLVMELHHRYLHHHHFFSRILAIGIFIAITVHFSLRFHTCNNQRLGTTQGLAFFSLLLLSSLSLSGRLIGGHLENVSSVKIRYLLYVKYLNEKTHAPLIKRYEMSPILVGEAYELFTKREREKNGLILSKLSAMSELPRSRIESCF